MSNPKRLRELIGEGIDSVRRDGATRTYFKVTDYLKRRIFKSDSIEKQYSGWIKKYDTLCDEDIRQIEELLDGMTFHPLFSIIVYNEDASAERERKTIASIISQYYHNIELFISEAIEDDVIDLLKSSDIKVTTVKGKDIGSYINESIGLSSGEYTLITDCKGKLSPHHLFTYLCYMNGSDACIFYSDEDWMKKNGERRNPYFKGEWNRLLFQHQNFLSHPMIKTELLKRYGTIGEDESEYHLLSRIVEMVTDESIMHVPHILYHNYGTTPSMDEWKTKGDSQIPGQKRVNHAPKVSIIIPAKDNAESLRQCIGGIFDSDYHSFEIVVVNSGSKEKSTVKYLSEIKNDERIKVIDDHNPFNRSRINNEATKICEGDCYLFLSDYIRIFDKHWLMAMVETIGVYKVGIVGPKLLYPNGKVQHSGIVLGMGGVAGHPFRHLKDNDGGYFGMANTERYVSAVTGDCMLVTKEAFEEIGGFDENLPFSFNNVDLCLRAIKRGYHVAYQPNSKLYYSESHSRDQSADEEQLLQDRSDRRYMIEKYGGILLSDRFYSPYLTTKDENVRLSNSPAVNKPWRDWIEFVCPFHRGDAILGIQVANNVASGGKRVRMHVSKDIIDWLSDFEIDDNLSLVPIDQHMPRPERSDDYQRKASEMVCRRSDSSGLIINARPETSIESTGIDLLENFMHSIGYPIGRKLNVCRPKEIDDERKRVISDRYPFIKDEYVLLHPFGGWSLKSMNDSIIKTIMDTVHKVGYSVIQIGGSSDHPLSEVDGHIMDNLGLSEWAYIFKRSKAIVGIDSWTSHFAAIMGINQAILYSSTRMEDVFSKSHFAEQEGKVSAFDSKCELASCNSLICPKGCKNCEGMWVDEIGLSSLLTD